MTASAVDELLARAVSAGLTPGAVAAWGRWDGDPKLAVVGHSRLLPEAVPASPDTWYDLASLTKPLVTGTLTLLAVRDGTIAMTTTVGDVLAEASDRAIGAATVWQLLAHAAGLPGWRPIYALAPGPDDVIDVIVDLELERDPGAGVEYSCPGFVLLGGLLERVLGQPLVDAFETRVAAPLGLGGSIGFRPDPSVQQIAGGAAEAGVEHRLCAEMGVSTSAIPAVGPHLPDDGNARFLTGVAGNAGLFGTAPGVFRLASQYLVGASQLLSPDEIALATARATGGEDPGEQVRALGWQLAASPDCSAGPALGGAAFGHTGFTGTSVWVDPDREAIFVLLANRHHPNHHEVDLHPLRRRFHAVAASEIGTS